MLSGAKHLQYLLENEQMQILRSAPDRTPGTFCAADRGSVIIPKKAKAPAKSDGGF